MDYLICSIAWLEILNRNDCFGMPGFAMGQYLTYNKFELDVHVSMK